MQMSEFKSDIPWHDSKKWKRGKWYPLPIGYMARDYEGWIHDSYGIFVLEKGKDNGDIYPIISGDLTFTQAVAICEDKNGCMFTELGSDDP
jgi:hypothetical protein